MIRSNKALNYDKRNASKKGIIQLEIPLVVRNIKEKKYILTIEDYLIDTYEQELFDELGNSIGFETIERKTQLNTKTMALSYAESNALTDMCDSLFEITETKTERRDKYTILGLLLVTKQDPIYGSNANDWELC
jgi:hypothetical protein